MLIACVLAATLSLTPPDSTADLRAFRGVLDDFTAAFNTRDARRFVRHFAADGDFMQAFGRYRADRALTQEFMAFFFTRQDSAFRAVEAGTRVKRITDDVAFVEMEMTGDAVRNRDGTLQPHRRGQLMLVMRRTGARWEVASYRYLDIHPGPIRKD
jgi:uncharacterized protein (TIGR02246 family)